jgi:tRNA U34 5-carboxymethylaminomethyl modifying enzyme MnmG/GidA
MLSQMVTKVFERVLVENKQQQQQQQQQSGQNAAISKQIDLDQLKSLSKEAPSWMNESSQDAYMLLQVIKYIQ